MTLNKPLYVFTVFFIFKLIPVLTVSINSGFKFYKIQILNKQRFNAVYAIT